jgi:hypothetical protein
MADITTVRQISDNAGNEVLAARAAFNKKAKSGQGIAGRTRILNLAKSNMTQAELDSVLQFLQRGGVAGTNDAHTVVGVSSDGGDAGGTDIFVTGESDNVKVAIQGTGAFTAASDFGGVTGVTSSLVAEFAGLQA